MWSYREIFFPFFFVEYKEEFDYPLKEHFFSVVRYSHGFLLFYYISGGLSWVFFRGFGEKECKEFKKREGSSL